MHLWTVIRFFHLLAMAFFVGGQLMLVLAVAPGLGRHRADEPMQAIARRFGRGSAVAVVVLVATGVAMGAHYSLWSSHVLQVKIAIVALIGVLTFVHIRRPSSRTLSYALTLASLVVVWLGVKLTYG
jgi:uncharacterized membrane protein